MLLALLPSFIYGQQNAAPFLQNYTDQGQIEFFNDYIANWNVNVNLDDLSLQDIAAQADAKLSAWMQMQAQMAVSQFGDLNGIT